jgi:molybdate transport system permease protein
MFNFEVITKAFGKLLVFIYVIIIVVPVVALLAYSGAEGVYRVMTNKQAFQSISLGIYTSLISLVATFIFGTAAAFYISLRKKSSLSKSLDILFQIPVVLPPAASGIGLLLAFGRNGIIGKFLNCFDINIVFTPAAVILAQFFVSSAFYIQILKTSVQQIPKELYEAAYVQGAGRVETIIKIILPMVKKAVVSGLLLSFIRALGEFGTTIMFAGNIAGKTRTIPLQIYTFFQSDIISASALASILYISSFVLLFIVKTYVEEKN